MILVTLLCYLYTAQDVAIFIVDNIKKLVTPKAGAFVSKTCLSDQFDNKSSCFKCYQILNCQRYDFG
jgi:hypothetical protein